MMIWLFVILQIIFIHINWWAYNAYYMQPKYNHPAIFWNPLARKLLLTLPWIGIIGLAVSAFFYTDRPWLFLLLTAAWWLLMGYRGYKSVKGNTPSLDFKYFEHKAWQGDADAQFNLGNCYASAQGTYLDHDKAGEWWEKAAAQGHIDAQHNLVVLSKMRGKFSRDESHVLPTLTKDGLTLETFTTEELLEDIRLWKKETAQQKRNAEEE